ncbi:MAG: hypothetical protein K2X34_08285 [Hyphomonadaceae bacterium]|nr:hypothetical protein [Hyphomonadaceae bacterium]
MIKVHPAIYKILWWSCLLLGLLLLAPAVTFLLLLPTASVAFVSLSTPFVLSASTVVGIFLIWLSWRRLTRPLKASGGGSE